MARAEYPLRLPTRLPLLWRLTVLGLTMGALVARASAWLEGEPFGALPTLVIMAIAVPSVLLVYVGFCARAGAAGLKLFDGWGLPRRLGWHEIRDVRIARWPYLLFAPALRVELVDGRARWLPRETQNLGALHALAREHAGADHPLVQALETPLHRL